MSKHSWCGALVLVIALWWAAPLPVHAIPITAGEYMLTGGVSVDTFTLVATATPFSAWSFSDGQLSWNNLTDVVVLLNTDACFFCSGGPAALFTRNNLGDVHLTLFSNGDYHLFDPSYNTVTDNGQWVQNVASVPEPSASALLMIGMLVFAGARWWTHRREGLQRGYAPFRPPPPSHRIITDGGSSNGAAVFV